MVEMIFAVDFLCQNLEGLLGAGVLGAAVVVVVVVDVVGGNETTLVGVCTPLLSRLRMVFVFVPESSVTLT